MTIVAGIDEVGTGAWAGPYVSCTIVFRSEDIIKLPQGVRDSKKTTDIQRRQLYDPIRALAADIGIGLVWPFEIDFMGPSTALQLCYKRSLDQLKQQPEILLVDGKNNVSAWNKRQIVEPKADVNFVEVSSASIIAKVFRDKLMEDYERDRAKKKLTLYGWDKNKGYGTKDHIDVIKTFGLVINPEDATSDHSEYVHRRRYCRNILEQIQNS